MKKQKKTKILIDDYFIFNPTLINIMRNDILITNWINNIYTNYTETKVLNLDKYILTLPKNYESKIKEFSFDYNISKVNLLLILIYKIIKPNKKKYTAKFVKYIYNLYRVNISMIIE